MKLNYRELESQLSDINMSKDGPNIYHFPVYGEMDRMFNAIMTILNLTRVGSIKVNKYKR